MGMSRRFHSFSASPDATSDSRTMDPTRPSIEIDRARIAERHLLTHPFYQAWTAGTLPREALLDYAGQYYAFESNLPGFLRSLAARVESAAAREALLANARDEEHGPNNHPELWLRFGEALGLERSQVLGARLHATTQALVDTYREAAEARPRRRRGCAPRVRVAAAGRGGGQDRGPARAYVSTCVSSRAPTRVSRRRKLANGLAFFEVHRDDRRAPRRRGAPHRRGGLRGRKRSASEAAVRSLDRAERSRRGGTSSAESIRPARAVTLMSRIGLLELHGQLGELRVELDDLPLQSSSLRRGVAEARGELRAQRLGGLVLLDRAQVAARLFGRRRERVRCLLQLVALGGLRDDLVSRDPRGRRASCATSWSACGSAR